MAKEIIDSVEKLEEELEEYKFKVQKAEEQFISEYVMNSTYR